ncbi:MAG: outer membrane protein insertion porin family [Planctomycetota bacterium]|jgi:outer membrane protein insertion porin family
MSDREGNHYLSIVSRNLWGTLMRCVLLLLVVTASSLHGLSAQESGSEEQTLVREDRFEGLKVLSIEVEGATRYSDDRLRAALGHRAGDSFSRVTIDKGLDNLWSLFHARADISGKVEPEGVHLLLTVVEHPSDFEPRFIGYDEVDLSTILDWTQLQDRRELYFHQVPRVQSLVIEGYRKKGFHHAQVHAVIREPEAGDDPDMPGDVIFEIVEGPLVNVSEVFIHGNKSLPDTGFMLWKNGLTHLSSLELEGPSLFDWNGADFVEETLQADLVAMRNVYRDRGYLDAVVELDELEFSEDRSWVDVHIVLDEGRRFTVTKVSIEGFDQKPNPGGEMYVPLTEPAELYYPLQDLMDNVTLSVGDPYLRTSVTTDRFALREYYGKDGYIEHGSLGPGWAWKWLEPELIFDLETAEVEVIYRVAQGKQLRIREVSVSGTTHTRDDTVRRHISVDPGDLADMSKITSSLRRLNRLGYFSDEQDPIGHRDPYFVFHTNTGDEGLVDIEFIVDEGRVVQFALAGGIDSNDGLFGIISLTMNNFDLFDPPSSFFGSFGEVYRKEAFHGGGQTLSIEISPGAQRESSRISFTEPDVFGLHRDAWSMTTEFSIYDRIYEYDEEKRTTARLSFGRQIGYDGSFNVGLKVRQNKVSDVDLAVLLDPEMGALTQEIGVSKLNSFTFGAGYRSTDAAFNPKSGRIVNWRNDLSLDLLGTDWEMYSSRVSWDEYFRVGSEEEAVPSGFRLSMGMGIALPFGDTDVVPYSERLFLGGFNTLRGFRFRGVGPYSTDGHVLGGESMLRASLEYRYPLVTQTRPGSYQEIEMFRTHLFIDAGVLGPDTGTLPVGEMRTSVGFGFALIYPIPISFNFGFPLNADPFDREQVFSFNIATR